MTSIALLGIGAMGSRVAKHLLDDGLEVTVWNRHREACAVLEAAGARVADSPRDAAAQRDIVMSLLTDDDACRAVWLDGDAGAARGVGPDTLVLECSTVSHSWVDELAQALPNPDLLLDAPVVGSRPQAEARALHFLVGGDATILARARTLLEPLAAGVHHAGPRGKGAVLKLLVNTLFAVQVATLGELHGAARHSGIDPNRLQELLANLPVTSPAATGAGALIASERHAPLFPIHLVAKDLRYAARLLNHASSAPSLTRAALAAFEDAGKQGWQDQNITAVAKVYQHF